MRLELIGSTGNAVENAADGITLQLVNRDAKSGRILKVHVPLGDCASLLRSLATALDPMRLRS